MARDYTARRRDDGDGCCWSLCRCLARVPCSSFCVFLTLIAGLLGFIGSLLVGFYRTRDLIEQPDILPWFLYACVGVTVGMLVFASAFLAVNSSAASLSHSTNKQNLCFRIVTCIILTLSVLLQMAWLLLTVVSAAPLLVLLLVFQQSKTQSRVNLSHYGIPAIPNKPPVHMNNDLALLTDGIQKAELLVCYSASLVCATIVTASMSFILINTAYNYARLKTSKSKESGGSHLISAYSDGIKSTETVLL